MPTLINLWRHAVVLLGIVVQQTTFAQFSPGELSRAHEQLEGMKNCTRCHEVGATISGAKCLTCHNEIQASLDAKRGYHFNVSSQQCIACHKDHLGKDSRITKFDAKTFDHAQTGFLRKGKHGSTECANCHAKKNIADPAVLAILSKNGRSTYLGLSQDCLSCHTDKHNGTVGRDCSKCHGTTAWSPVAGFDHTKTKFVLDGRHARVACARCHTSLEAKEKNTLLLFTTKNFEDCSPCHATPHGKELSAKACASCHTPEDWKIQRAGAKFNHDLTAFKLVGRHVSVPCEKCHTKGTKSSAGKSLKLAHKFCTDCHEDYHKGIFAAAYKNDCERCHTAAGFSPSTFPPAAHAALRLPLKGAHAATPCGECHVKGGDGRKRFRFDPLSCETCHKDKHGGQFARQMAGQSCAACHSTIDWFPKDFDHSKTAFALAGKHAQTPCRDCHKPPNGTAGVVVRYKGTPTRCEDCHKEVHAGQFAAGGETECAKCHQPLGWKALVFDHASQSAFPLTGAHLKVECRSCHHEELIGGKTFNRYKPLSTRCESCHAPGMIGDG